MDQLHQDRYLRGLGIVLVGRSRSQGRLHFERENKMHQALTAVMPAFVAGMLILGVAGLIKGVKDLYR